MKAWKLEDIGAKTLINFALIFALGFFFTVSHLAKKKFRNTNFHAVTKAGYCTGLWDGVWSWDLTNVSNLLILTIDTFQYKRCCTICISIIFQDGIFDLDYKLRLVDRGGGSISNVEYKQWRNSGNAFEFQKYTVG